jgi:hypothetical protein
VRNTHCRACAKFLKNGSRSGFCEVCRLRNRCACGKVQWGMRRCAECRQMALFMMAMRNVSLVRPPAGELALREAFYTMRATHQLPLFDQQGFLEFEREQLLEAVS